ncbi:MAG: iron uptake porin [Cyanobacteriota bacterium]|nr:iron uptake porin [Cyanobacteriota bacterium]
MLICFGKLFVFVSKIAVIFFCLSQRVEAKKPKQNFNSFHPQFVQSDLTRKVTNVWELSDIQSNEWYFKVLQYFIQRYGIDTGYPLDYFQRQGTIKRQEFALIVNKVIQHLDKLQNDQQANFATQEELEALRRLQTEFTSELNILEKQIDALEENSFPSFSTTSRLSGEVIFALTGVGEGNKADDDEKIDSDITFSSSAKLQLNTTFTGKDRLKTSLKTSNIRPLNSATNSDMARLAYRGDKENQLELGDITYRFPIGDKARVEIGVDGLDINDFADSVNPYIDSDDDGAVSRFAQRNPIFRQGGGAGIGIKYEISDNLELGLGYVADDADEPENGLIKSDYAAIAQLTLEPSKTSKVGLNYIHSYNNIDTNTGSEGANDPFDDNSESINGNSFGLQASVAFNQNLLLGSWVGYTRAKANDLSDKPTASILNWAVTFAFPNLGNKGNLGGIIIGQPPKLIQNQYKSENKQYIDKDTSLHLEAFYRLNINNNISITPGVIVITNPEHNNDNDTIYIGTLRTTFSF